MDPLIKVLDIAITAMNVATRANELIGKSRSEGRDITEEEIDELIQESDKRRAAWNEA